MSRAGRALRGTGRWALRVLAGAGVVLLVLTVVGAALDVASFDRTRGGYEPPYEGWTGEPIDWSAGAVSSTGYLSPGRVVDTHLDCTSGMISFAVWGMEVDFRVVSDRALTVHRPREACEAAGFAPRF